MMVIYASWLIDLNSENNKGRSETIITIVVLITAWNVFFLQKLIDSSIDRFIAEFVGEANKIEAKILVRKMYYRQRFESNDLIIMYQLFVLKLAYLK